MLSVVGLLALHSILSVDILIYALTGLVSTSVNLTKIRAFYYLIQFSMLSLHAKYADE